jgi:hypothetical protein
MLQLWEKDRWRKFVNNFKILDLNVDATPITPKYLVIVLPHSTMLYVFSG